MLTIEETRKILWEEFTNLSNKEIQTIRDEMLNFWQIFLEEEGLS